MKKIFTLSILLVPILLNAQLLNGSFEDDGSAPSTTYWQHTCDDPVSYADAAPGWGLWCIQKQYGNTQSCFPSLVYQTIPGMDDGEIWTVSGWARTDSLYVGTQVGVFLGTKEVSTEITFFEGDQTAAPTWTFLNVTDTIHLNPGDSGVVVLSAGLVGGPMFGLAYFDGIQLTDSTIVGIEENPATQLNVFPSPAVGELYIGSRGYGNKVDVNIFDLTGKLVQRYNALRPYSGSTIHLDVGGLITGTYLVQVIDGENALTARFYKK